MKIAVPAPFNLKYTLECGQAFRWREIDGWYCAAVKGQGIKCRQVGTDLEFFTAPQTDNVALIRDYFRLDDNLTAILREIDKDDYIHGAIEKYKGLRLLRQDPWECLVSYICSAASSVKKIGQDVDRISKMFGNKLELESYLTHTFPTPEALARGCVADLCACSVGFRSEYIHEAAKAVASRRLDLESLRRKPYEDAKQILLEYKGIGEKIADCVLLFSLDKLEAFPVDRWIRRAMQENYQECRDANDREIRAFASRHFGRYTGYAQEYIYQRIRDESRA
ncbi:MAG: DNA glycosylase [Candidatus Thermoplasmatota archaeon]|nr:DNA glycosylase [Candidatus Thermoplasmatota archaeon]